MKFLRNPFLIGGVVLVALVVMALSFRGTLARARLRKTAAASASTVSTADAAAVAAAAASSTAAASPMDKPYLAARFGEWVQSPGRDPFELYPRQQMPERRRQQRSALLLLRLEAIWRQTGRNIAVINTAIVTEGDEVAGFRVQRIEADRVFVIGESGTERLEFGSPGAPPLTAPPRRPPGMAPEVL